MPLPPIALGVMNYSVLRTKSRKSRIEKTSIYPKGKTAITTKKAENKTILNNYPQGKINITPNEIGGLRMNGTNNPKD
jgi:hypothetical protein